jgi:hypothetical protein
VLGTIFFALLPGAITHQVDATSATLSTRLAAVGVPAGRQPAVVAGIRACLRDRSTEDDPAAQPASCQAAGSAQIGPAIGAYAQTVVRTGFRDTAVRTMGVSFLLLSLAFATAFLLPRKARPEAL